MYPWPWMKAGAPQMNATSSPPARRSQSRNARSNRSCPFSGEMRLKARTTGTSPARPYSPRMRAASSSVPGGGGSEIAPQGSTNTSSSLRHG